MNIYRSKKGFLCAEKNGKNIHSQYNPHREAERFADISIKGSPSLIILLGAGLGYIQEALTTKFPDTPILAVFYNSTIFDNCQYHHENIHCWHQDSGMNLNTFFFKNIQEKNVGNLNLAEWNPSSLIFSDLSLQVNKVLKAVIQQLNGNIKTTAVFGKKWVRNMLCNYLSVNTYCTMRKENVPIVIASSGPSLKNSLPLLHTYRKKFRLWALPSSLKALIENGLIPDMLISSDPGYYGSYHLRFLQDNIPAAMPLTASRGLWKNNNPAIILNQSFPFEKDLYELASLPEYRIPSNGTVSGTALEIAGRESSRIYFTGLDLCTYDIQSHINPHSFDNLLFSQTDKTNPIHNIFYKRSCNAVPDFTKGIRTSKSLDTYRNWFNIHCKNLPVKRVNPSPVHIDNMNSGVLSELEDFKDLPYLKYTYCAAQDVNSRKKIVRSLIDRWETDLVNGDKDDLLYFIDTKSFSKDKGIDKALNFIRDLRGIYG